ncbi:protein FAR1-RELATED SEQUENCE 5-like [Bidens hawaiensis]|uniref:protein FAR1-RELATED SEQUENCE 5-like n=1 Tax=Bidens hawaiensis TaxID=980011 RepID=UPI00404A6BB2
MKKLPAKVSGDVIENTNVRSRIHRLVWNMFITLDTFDSRWHYLIEKFGLQDNEWLNDMFEIRDHLVPAYFREIPFCCLMKTTSRCESSNATFKVNSTSANTLYNWEEIERHAFELYTQAIFNEVRKEIMKGKYCCYVTHTESIDDHVLYSVTHLDKRKDITNIFLVNFDPADNSASCSCMGFTRIGFLCRHVFCVYRIKKVDKIPLKNADVVDDNESVFEEIIGNVNEGDDFIENPDAVRTKGCGKVRRVMGDSENIVEKEGKAARLCRTCSEYVHHDSRNCPLNPKNKKKKYFADLESSDNV